MKFILGIVIGVLVIIFMIQNVQVVEIKFLAWTATISRALMVLIVFVFGIFIGWVVRSIGYRKKRREREEEAQ